MHDNIREHMDIIGADGAHVGTVDKVEGGRIKLTKKDSGGAGFGGGHQDHHHFIPLGLVAGVEGDKVRLSANADVAVTFEEEAGGEQIEDDSFDNDSGVGETDMGDTSSLTGGAPQKDASDTNLADDPSRTTN